MAAREPVKVGRGGLIGTDDASVHVPDDPPAPFLTVEELKAYYMWGAHPMHNQMVLSHMAEQLRLTLAYQGMTLRASRKRRSECKK